MTSSLVGNMCLGHRVIFARSAQKNPSDPTDLTTSGQDRVCRAECTLTPYPRHRRHEYPVRIIPSFPLCHVIETSLGRKKHQKVKSCWAGFAVRHDRREGCMVGLPAHCPDRHGHYRAKSATGMPWCLMKRQGAERGACRRTLLAPVDPVVRENTSVWFRAVRPL